MKKVISNILKTFPMKNLYSCLFILIFLNSCSNDDAIVADNGTAVSPSLHHVQKIGDIMPDNSDNPYDYAGKIHNELLECYFETGPLPVTVSGIVDRVALFANSNAGFNAIKVASYQTPSAESIAYVAAQDSSAVMEVISHSSMSALAKPILSNFVDSLLTLCPKEDSPEAMYNFISVFEATVMGNASLGGRDKRIILITTAVARHSICLAKKHPKKNTDPDWTIFVGNIIATTEHAGYGTAEAVVAGLAAGIVQNQ
jgi:hypothetical protein